MVAMLAGSDFIKTSTGKESMNATLHVGIAMCRAIKDYQRHRTTKYKPMFLLFCISFKDSCFKFFRFLRQSDKILDVF